jgi:5-hydroxyisourate hydrolase
MSGITTHALDTARGRPAAGLPVALERQALDGTWEELGRTATDHDGRAALGAPPEAGVYRLTFDIGGAFWPEVSIVFAVTDPGEHYHVPLLFSPYQYTTYRGS